MLTIREMTEADVTDIAAMEAETFSMPWSAQDFRDLIRNSAMHYLVAEADGVLLGGGGFMMVAGECQITNVAIRKEHRGRGYGKLLVQSILRAAMEAGASDVTLEVRRSNVPAIRLYENLGFQSAGIRPGFYEKPTEDAVIYWMRGIKC